MGCPSKGMSHQPIDTSVTLTTPLMQEGSKCCTVAQVYAKRENILAPHLCHENGTGLTPACRSQTAVGRRAWGSSYALRTRQVGVCNCNFNRVVSHFCRSRASRDLRLKGRGRLSWRPLLIIAPSLPSMSYSKLNPVAHQRRRVGCTRGAKYGLARHHAARPEAVALHCAIEVKLQSM